VAAQYLDCDIAELDRVPTFWRDAALMALVSDREVADPDTKRALRSLNDDIDDIED
jgi:hypothetical protein